MSSPVASRIYAVAAWLLIAIGVLHMATTWRLSAASPFTRVWFFGAGIAMVQAGALNLLSRRYGRDAPGLAWVTRGGNLFLLAFAAVAGAVTNATAAELALILGVLATVLLLSFLPAAYRIGTLPSRYLR